MEVTSMDVPMDDGMKHEGRRRYKRRGSATKYNLEGYAANMVAQQPHHHEPPQPQKTTTKPTTTTKPSLDFDIFQQALQLSDMSLDHPNDEEPNPAQRRRRRSRRSSHGAKQLPTEVAQPPPPPPRRRYARRGSATRYSIENYQINHQQ